MIDKKQIIKMAKHVFKRSRGIPDKRLIHPRREWTIGLCIFTLILFGGSALSAHSFIKYKNVDVKTGESYIKIPRYNETLIKNVLEVYTERETLFSTYTKDVPPVPVNENEEDGVASTTDSVMSTATTTNEVSPETDGVGAVDPVENVDKNPEVPVDTSSVPLSVLE